ncbi:MAG: alpha/beta hydrolase superfamily protein SupD [Rhodospirillales bacterium]|nr:alpha/beta hydrolase superfamily protein SupD [Rhodospirillales bacterium]
MPAEPSISFEISHDDGATTVVRRHGNPRGIRFVLSHGNGFAIDGYRAFWELLLPDFEIVVFDQRNHGRNASSSPERHTYEQMAGDLARLRDGITAKLGARTTVGLFHSISARIAIMHAIETARPWDAMVLFDPPNIPPPGHPLHEAMQGFEIKIAAWAEKRQAHFADPGELAAQFARAKASASWTPAAHRDMARAVLRPEADGKGWRLTCPPALEAKLYTGALAHDLWVAPAVFGSPVTLIAADPTLPNALPSALANQAWAAEQRYHYAAIPGTSHMLQIEKPAETVAAVKDFLARAGLPMSPL